MKKYTVIFTILITIFFGITIYSVSQAADLGNCMVDSLTGKERKQLARWIFFAIAAHPEIKPYSITTEEDIRQCDEITGKLITRLLTEDCPDELKMANNLDPMSLQNAFGLVGQVAMQELMANEDVRKAISNYVRYVDQEKINSVLGEK